MTIKHFLTLILVMTSLQIQAAPPTTTLSIDVGDFYYPYITVQENKNVLPQLLSEVQMTANYTSDEEIEGVTQKTRKHLKFFDCLVGVTCFPSPHVESKTTQVVKEAKSKVTVQAKKDAPYQLTFSVPQYQQETVAGKKTAVFSLSSIELNFQLKPIWAQPSVKTWIKSPGTSFGKSKVNMASSHTLLLVPSPQDNLYQTACLAIRDPIGYESAGLLRLRAKYTLPNGKEAHFAPEQDCTNIGLDQKKINASSNADIKIAISDKHAQLVGRVSVAEGQVRVLAMPASAPRWAGLKHYNYTKGTMMTLANNGPFTLLTLQAETLADRKADGRLPVKEEQWTLLSGQLVNYSGSFNYGNNASEASVIYEAKFFDGQKIGSEAKTKSNDFEQLTATCQSEGCRKNLKEAEQQVSLSQAALQAELAQYLKLYASAPKVH